MDDVTDTVFRQVIAGTGRPDVFFTEFVNVDGLQSSGRPALLKKLRFSEKEQPLIVQLWGKDPGNFYKTAQEIVGGRLAREAGAPAGCNFAAIDLNMGCPDKTVVKGGACSALMNNRELAAEIMKAVQEGTNRSLPLTVKTRLGFDAVDMSWPEFLLEQHISLLTIHGRTRKELSKVPANWDAIGEVSSLRSRISPDTLIMGNGDVMSRQQGLELAARHKLDGIMIGRGIFNNPFIFASSTPWTNYTRNQRIALYTQHIKLFADTWSANTRPLAILNKFCKVYINGFDGAKELRERVARTKDADDMIKLLTEAQIGAERSS
jgi:tRNA-dihydrouridine synthase